MNNDIKIITYPPKSMSEPIVNPLPDLQNFFQPQVSEVDIPKDYLCPITHLLFREPVSNCDGQTYEREALKH